MCKLFASGPPAYGAPQYYYVPAPVVPLAPCYPVVEPALPARSSSPISDSEYQRLKSWTLKKALGSRKYTDLIDEIRENMRAARWAKDEDYDSTSFKVAPAKAADRRVFNKEITFSTPSTSYTPNIKCVGFGHDSWGQFYRGTWQYSTRADNLIRVWCNDWELDIKRENGRDHYTLRTKHNLVGAVRIDIEGKSYIVYTHLDDSKRQPDARSITPPPSPPSTRRDELKVPPKDSGAQELAKERERLAKERRELEAERQRLKAWEDRLNVAQTGLNKEKQDVAQQKRDLEQKAATLEAQRKRQAEEEKRLTQLAATLAAQETANKEAAGRNAELARQLAAQKQQQDQKAGDLDALAKKLEKEKQGLANERKTLAGIQTELTATGAAQKKERADLEELRRQLEQSAKELAAKQAAATKADADVKELRSQLEKNEEKRSSEHAALQKQLKAAEQAAADAKKEADAAAASAKTLLGQLQTRERALAAGEERVVRLQRELETRSKALDGRDAELTKLAASLQALKTDLDRREADQLAERALEKKKADDLTITEREQPKGYAGQLPSWSATAAKKEQRLFTVRENTRELPEWMRLVCAADFGRSAYEAKDLNQPFEYFLAGGDQEKAREIQFKDRDGNEKKTFEADAEWYRNYVENAYSPIRIAISDLLIVAEGIIDSDGRGEDVPDSLKNALAAYDRAVKGGLKIAKEKDEEFEGPQEERYGLADKMNELQKRAAALRAQKTRTKEEDYQLQKLEEVLYRMKDFDDLFTRIKPHVEVLRTALAENKEGKDLVKALFSELKPPAVASPESYKPAIDGLFAKGQPANIPVVQTTLDAMTRVSASDPVQIRASLGDEAALSQLDTNLDLALAAVQSKEWQDTQLSFRVEARKREVFGILTSGKPLAERQKALEDFASKTLGSSTVGKTVVRDFLSCDTKEQRSKVFWKLMEPFMERINADFLTERTALEQQLKAASGKVKESRKMLAVEGVMKRTDTAYLRFAGAESHNPWTFNIKDDEKIAELKVETRKYATAALAAIDAEQRYLTELLKDAPKGSPLATRSEVIARRRSSITDWQQRDKEETEREER